MPFFASAFFLFIALVIAGYALWFLACQMSPLGYEVSPSRVGTAIILMAVCILLTDKFVVPRGGMILGCVVFMVVAVLIVKCAFRLSLFRSAAVALIYVVGCTIAWSVTLLAK
jgi:hypothetical protein